MLITKMEQNILSYSNTMNGEFLTILLVEDNFLNRRFAKKILEKNYLIIETDNAESATKILDAEKVHIVIIDIHLGNDKKNGIWLGQYIHEKLDIPFIYLTAYGLSEVSQRAIDTQPESYLTKPFKEADLVLSVEIALKRYFATHPEKYNWVLVKENEFYTKLPAEAIDYFESIGNYLNVVSNGKLYKCRSTIKEMLTLLPARLFIQTHRAFIVNKRKISKFNAVSVHIGELRIPVSEKYAKSVMQKGF